MSLIQGKLKPRIRSNAAVDALISKHRPTSLIPARLDPKPSREPTRQSFPGSAAFWEDRYASGGTSGRGSRGTLAEYKAAFLNDFVKANDIASITELGCGDGVQVGMGEYPDYVGMDVSPTAVRNCIATFADDPTKTFLVYTTGALSDPLRCLQSDAAISLDVLFHLVEQEVFETYLRDLFSLGRRFVVIFASDEVELPANKAIVRRPFTTWVEENITGWHLVDRVENPHRAADLPRKKSYSDFFIYAAEQEAAG